MISKESRTSFFKGLHPYGPYGAMASKQYLNLFIFVLFSFTIGNAQFTITGKVVDDQTKPIEGVEIYIKQIQA